MATMPFCCASCILVQVLPLLSVIVAPESEAVTTTSRLPPVESKDAVVNPPLVVDCLCPLVTKAIATWVC
jgi:hypothetical protein